MKNDFSNFVGRFPLSKTLRFELKPIDKTLEHINAKGLITQDQQRAVSYKAMKNTIDGFHKYFIDLAMQNVVLTKLEVYRDLYFAPVERKKEDIFKKELDRIQTDLRKQISQGFQIGAAKSIFSKLDKKELITEELERWIRTEKKEDVYFDESFKNFTTYFSGFHENRKNMYSDKAQSTGIAFRLIHENLPKFLDNIKIFDRLKNLPDLYDKCGVLYKDIEEYLNIPIINDAFNLEYFNEVLTQSQIDVYNLIVGGRSPKEGAKKIQGLNEYINLYNQKQKDKTQKIPKLKILYKQILSDREKTSYVLEKFDSSKEVLEAINGFYHHELISFLPEGKEDSENVLFEIQNLLSNIKEFDLNKIYIRNDRALTDISITIFGEWSIIKDALYFNYRKKLSVKKELTQKQENEIEKYLKQPYFSIAEIENALWEYRNEVELLNNLHLDDLLVSNYFKTHFTAQKKESSDKEFNLISNIEAKYSCIKGVLEHYSEEKILHQDKTVIDNIKLFLDAIMELLHFVKPLALPSDTVLEKDENFYGQFNGWYEQLNQALSLYNKVRNYSTQKAYSTEKFKLNFENSTLLSGWDVNKEEANTAILFKKDDKYFLGIMNKHHNKIFREIPQVKVENYYSKINYKLLPGASKMLPKVFFSNKNITFYEPNEEILRIRNHSSHTKGGTPQDGYGKIDFNVEDCRKMIGFFKDSIAKHPEWHTFGFNFSDTSTYNSIDEFYREVEAQGYNISYTKIPDSYINQLVDEGKLYLFQIYNKDFSSFSKGAPNLHTLYWKALFDDENLRDVVYKLNGQAEIFYRRKSIQDNKVITHKANKAIENKNPKSLKKQSTFEYDIVKDRRFTTDKFQFHVPITMNFKASGTDYINNDVLDYLQNNPDVNIIGIDRGERHLIYISLIDQQGNILRQQTLNSITSEKHDIETPYHTLLGIKEKERDAARKNWGTIENIKELKEGYLSQVVHKIARMMVEHNAIVVLEDLNFGFKRGRFKVEKQVYQKLEKMLIDKLNYLVFKDKRHKEHGGLYKALQLTGKFTSFKELGKQTGFLFYVPAWNTSKIDPTTGFVNLFSTKYENVEKARRFFDNFKSIRFNTQENYFEFEIDDYTRFNPKAADTKLDWTVCTFGERILTYRNPSANSQWDSKEINLTEQLEDLLGKNSIVYGDGQCIKKQILELESKEFFKSLLDLFKLTLQMRNSKTGTDIDYLISPIKNSKNVFFDSRKADGNFPTDADANGAFHIAKKGLWMLEQINQFEGNDWRKLKLAISNKDWLNYAQKV
ncbi:MAG: type V CRISPR-associated protein Cas12a/Cpf1 [Bacteroidetes bacterium]|nr:type V CRISPR-associated protein Cas12a/Cpf1 [Bacteroidota bacterium]